MDPSQRTRMRKSSRKIEAVLGITPLVLQADETVKVPSTRPPITPRTRAHRRRGQLFDGSSSSSCSSDSDDDRTVLNISFMEMDDTEANYVFVKESTPHGTYLPHSLPSAVDMKTRSRSKSEAGLKSKSKAKSLPVPPVPAFVRADGGKQEKGTSQPILLRFSPPSSLPTHKSTASITSLASTLTTSPLSPCQSVFSLAPHLEDAREKEMKRKKLAKLARTLGENVPPELVFPQVKAKARRPSVSSSYPKRISRTGPRPSVTRPSATTVFPAPPVSAPVQPTPPAPTPTLPAIQTTPKIFKRTHRPRSLSVPLLHTSPIVQVEQSIDIHDETPCPAVFTSSSTAAPNAPTSLSAVDSRAPALRTHASSFSRRLGDMSLDSPRGRLAFEGLIASAKPSPLGQLAASAIQPPIASAPVSPRVATSLDIDRPFQQSPSRSPRRSPADYVYGPSRSRGHGRSQTAIDPSVIEDMHRRKEREWSGEWNVQDMGDVVKRLRELKGR